MGLLTALNNLFFDDEKLENIKLFGSEFREEVTLQDTMLHSIHTMTRESLVNRTNFSGYPSVGLSGCSTRQIMGMLDE